MGMLIYIILHRLCLVNEHNAMINLKNNVVKNIQRPNKKKSNDFGLEKAGLLQLNSFSWLQGHENLKVSRTVTFILPFLFSLYDEWICLFSYTYFL